MNSFLFFFKKNDLFPEKSIFVLEYEQTYFFNSFLNSFRLIKAIDKMLSFDPHLRKKVDYIIQISLRYCSKYLNEE